jgi:hypothetical protein
MLHGSWVASHKTGYQDFIDFNYYCYSFPFYFWVSQKLLRYRAYSDVNTT